MSEVFHKAGWVMMSPLVWLRRGVVGIKKGLITYVGPYKASQHKKVWDHGPGVIMPALVNAHTHLGLCMLKGKIDTGRGFLEWVKDLVFKRGLFSRSETEEALRKGVKETLDTGTGLVAEVGDLEPSRSVLEASALDTILFQEVLGHNPEPNFILAQKGKITLSLAGHALHTTSPQTLMALKELTRKAQRPFSIHLAESFLETEFLLTGKGEWAELLEARGIDFSLLGPLGQRPIDRALSLDLLDSRTIAVHLLDVTEKDVEILAKTRTKVVICPRSNLALHGKLPDIHLFLKYGIEPAIGTDSLASCPTLNMFNEMAFVAKNFPNISPQLIFNMATRNGAIALGRNDMGTMAKGNLAKLIYVHVEENKSEDVMRRILAGENMNIKRVDAEFSPTQ